MKANRLLCLVLVSLVISPAFAEYDEQTLPSPDMSAYMAYRTPKPPLSERASTAFYFFRGWYLAGGVGYGNVKVDSIQNVTPNTIPGAIIPSVVQTSISSSEFVPTIALGYQFRKSGIFSRAEISYLPLTNLTYDASPFINFTGTTNSLNSKISNNLILFKVYDDFNLDMPIMPYIQLGIGASINTVSGNSVISIFPTFPSFTANFDSSKTNVAGDAGLGARWLINDNFALGLGYEFDYLGSNAEWNMNFTNPIFPPTTVALKSGSMFANTIMATLSWEPIAKYSSEDTYNQTS